MPQEPRAEDLQCHLDAVAQPVADPAPFLDAQLVPAFKQAFMHRGAIFGQARSMQQPKDEGKLIVEVAIEDGFEIDRDVTGARRARVVAQQPQLTPIRYYPPQRIAAIEVFLHQSVRAPPPTLALAERLIPADDIYGCRVLLVAGPM